MEEELRQLQQKQQLQQLEDRAPKSTRGIFRRGRGRPRSRGYAARARARQRSAYVPVAARNSHLNENAAVTTVHEARLDESILLGNESTQNVHDDSGVEQQQSVDTVFSLLTDTCHSDEELDWSDVLKVMNDQRYWVTPRLQTVTKVYGRKRKPQSQKVDESEIVSTTQPPNHQMTTAKEESNGIEIKVKIENETSESTGIPETVTEEAKAKLAHDATDRNEKTEQLSYKFCQQPFQFKDQLQTQLLGDHSEAIGGYVCSNCLTCYESQAALSNHRNLCHGDRREYRCEHCHTEFPLKRALKEHVSKCQEIAFSSTSIDPSNQDTSKCTIARTEDDDRTRTTETTTSVASHCSDLESVDTKRNDKLEDASCSLQQPSKDIDEIRVEGSPESASIVTTAVADSSPVTCPDCNEQMQDTMELGIHRMRRHSVNRKDATCLLCDNKSFASSEEYEQHVLDHCKRLRISLR